MYPVPIRVAVVEDLPEIRAELVALIESDPGLELVLAVATGESAVQTLPAARPEVVLLDIGLPGMSGVECVRLLKPELPETEFMMLTIFEDHDQVIASLRAGATGYLVKGTPAERLLEAVHELKAGGSPMSSSIARDIVRIMQRPPEANPESKDARLSLREEEVLSALASGKRYKEIASQLNLSVHTVRTHLHRIYQKLHVRTKMEAIASFRHTHPENGRNFHHRTFSRTDGPDA